MAAVAAVRHMSEEPVDLLVGGQVRRGLAWSTVSTVILRAGTFAVGIVLARILSPEAFGTYAVALTVQAILMTLADFGLSSDLIRSSDPERKAPTVAVLGLVTGAVLTVIMAASAPLVAGALGSPEAAPVIAVLAVTLVLAGAGVVPFATLQRRFDQKRLFVIAVVDFAVSTVVTLTLLAQGTGVMALAIGRLAAQTVTLVLQFVFAKVRPRWHVDRALVRPILAFGIPVAAANLLSWGLLNIDNVVVVKMIGPIALGFYVLAFNISSWPMSAIGQVVRSVALPAFSRAGARHDSQTLARAVALAWTVALPAGALLAVLSVPLITFVYGAKWSPSAGVLAALGLFGAMRVVFDLCAAYLLARGASGAVLRVQVVWFLTLIPATIAGARWFGVAGAGWAHLAVAVLIVLPAYLWAARRVGAGLRAIAAAALPPTAAAVPAGALAWLVGRAVHQPALAVAAGAVLAGVVYLGLLHRWLPTQVRLAQGSSAVLDRPNDADATAPRADLTVREIS